MAASKEFNELAFRKFAKDLNPGAPDPTGLRNAIKTGCYPEIFEALRPYSSRIQEKLLVQGFGDPQVNMPNGEKLGRFLARVNNIEWFNPHEAVPDEEIREMADVAQQRIRVSPKELLVVRGTSELFPSLVDDNWTRAVDKAWNETASLADDSRLLARFAVGSAAEAAAGSALTPLGDHTMSPSYLARRAAEWILGEDLVGWRSPYKKGNPWIPMIDICEKGLWPMGQTKDNFVVYHPPVVLKQA